MLHYVFEEHTTLYSSWIILISLLTAITDLNTAACSVLFFYRFKSPVYV